mmetsp:Transcript_54318/g.129098  ORF Transcript_54318/g.129098 Transcript_54318/m.129098 type:complete len:757 (-) Transcript_54318:201-2471(-)
MAEAAKLKASVYRATCDSGGGEGDAAAMIEINEILLEHPHLITEAVKNVKARVKDRDPVVGVIALDLLDQLMQSHGFQLQLHVIKKVLPRVLKMATPMKGNPPSIQAKSAVLIRSWASTYGSDVRLKEYADSALTLNRSEEKVHMQQLQVRQRMAALDQYADREGRTQARQNPTSPNMRPQGQGGAGGGEIPMAQMSAQDEQAINEAMHRSQTQVVDLDQIRENLELMTSMMAADEANIRHNEVLGEVAVLCKGCQVAIMNQIGDINDEAQLSQFLAMNDTLADTLATYERKVKQGGTGAPRVSESEQTLTDGTTLASYGAASYLSSPEMRPLSPAGGVPQPAGYDEEAEFQKAIAESVTMAKQETVTASKRQDLEALEDLFGGAPTQPADIPYISPAAQLKSTNQTNSLMDSMLDLDVGGFGSALDAGFGSPAAVASMSPPRQTFDHSGNTPPPAFSPTAATSPPPNFAQPPPPPYAPDSDPFLSLSAATGSSPMAGTDSRPVLSVIGNTPGATEVQMATWMARLALNKEGVLYEDKLVQIGLKTALTATGGKLSLFVGNKADQQLTNFNLNVAFSPQITGACSTCAMFVDPKQQLQLVVTVDIRAPFAGPLPMSISFSVGDDNRTMNLTLPVLPHKFADPLPLEAGAFRSKWAAMLYTEPGVGVSVALQDKWAVDTAVQTMLGSSMKMAVQEGLPAGTVAGSASLTTPEGTATVLVQLEIDAGAKTASLLVRSDNPLVRDGFEAALQAILLKRA